MSALLFLFSKIITISRVEPLVAKLLLSYGAPREDAYRLIVRPVKFPRTAATKSHEAILLKIKTVSVPDPA
jgi:hypothetical protein